MTLAHLSCDFRATDGGSADSGSLSASAACGKDRKNPMSHSHSVAASDPDLLVKVKFGGVVLVCGDCQDRSSGPSKLKAKTVRKELKRGLVQSPVRLRIVESTCLGLCPKKAMAVAAVASGRPLLAAEVHSDEEAAALAATVISSFSK